MLNRLAKVFKVISFFSLYWCPFNNNDNNNDNDKDYCGVLNEESIRKNFILIYELLDEVIVSPLPLFFSFIYDFKKKKPSSFLFNN